MKLLDRKAKWRERAGMLGIRAFGLSFMVALSVLISLPSESMAQTQGREVVPEQPAGGTVPGNTLGSASDAELWRALRGGAQGSVSIPDQKAGVLIQSEGDNWRAIRNGPLKTYGAWVLLGMIALLALFFLLRGRIKIDAGPSPTGETIERFGGFERFVHWITAVSFIVLAITGINILWGKYFLMPLFGKEIFATLTIAGKYAHNYIAFPFMLGVALMFIIWVRHNIPNKYDLIWLAKGGGIFMKGVHPPSKKFNAGQKLIFWLVVLGGLSLSLSGLSLMFPFEMPVWAKTFNILNSIGFSLPTEVSPIMEMQLSTVWHAVVGVVMIAVILAHIYIGSVGMEGAFAAMGSGKVDINWAREHHNIWVAETLGESAHEPAAHPAE